MNVETADFDAGRAIKLWLRGEAGGWAFTRKRYNRLAFHQRHTGNTGGTAKLGTQQDTAAPRWSETQALLDNSHGVR